MNFSSISCAFFDVDGTLVKGFIIQSFPRYLADENFIESTYPDKIDRIISDYNSGKVTYREAAETIPSLYALALEGKSVKDVRVWAEKFMRIYLPRHLFAYSKPLVHNISSLVDVTIAVSGSPIETVTELNDMGFNRIYGSLFEERSGFYTSRVTANLILGEEKAKCAERIAKEQNIDLSKSLAFGDTDQDEPLLSMVGLPFAIQPNKKLRDISTARGWSLLEKSDLNNMNQIIEEIKRKIKSL